MIHSVRSLICRRLREIFSTLDDREMGLICLADVSVRMSLNLFARPNTLFVLHRFPSSELQVSMGIRILTGKSLSPETLHKIYECCIGSKNGVKVEVRSGEISEESNFDLRSNIVSFDQFCCIVAEYKHQVMHLPRHILTFCFSRSLNANNGYYTI